MLFIISVSILIYKLFGFSVLGLFLLASYYINNKKRFDKKYKDFNDLKRNVKLYHPEYNKFKLFIETSKLVMKKYKEEFLQEQFGIIKHVDNNLHVKYYKNYKPYIIILKQYNKKILQINIYDENGDDITEKIKPYMGFNYDFHGLDITPTDLGHNKLTFIVNKMKYVFNAVDIIYIDCINKNFYNCPERELRDFKINKDTINQ